MPMPTPAPTPTPAPVAEPEVDNLGYEVKPGEQLPTPAEEPKPGEGDEPPAPAEEPKPGEGDEPSAEKTPEQLTQEFSEVLKEVNDYDKELIAKFAVENKLNVDQVKAYAELQKAEDSKLEEERGKIRSGWVNDLKTDVEFGGENFAVNVDKVERLLEKHLPETKKILTERGTMLPPYIMKDLLGVYKTLNPTNEMVKGDPSKPVVQKNFLEEMYV